jgi:hypothetical protein
MFSGDGLSVHDERRHMKANPITKLAALAAIVLGLAAGSYGVASAASGSGSSNATTTPTPSQSAPLAANGQQPWGPQRSDETPLTGDTLAKVTAAAQAKVPGGTLVRVETDADGHAAYEAHMTKSDGTRVTVYVDKSFDVVGVESR